MVNAISLHLSHKTPSQTQMTCFSLHLMCRHVSHFRIYRSRDKGCVPKPVWKCFLHSLASLRLNGKEYRSLLYSLSIAPNTYAWRPFCTLFLHAVRMLGQHGLTKVTNTTRTRAKKIRKYVPVCPKPTNSSITQLNHTSRSRCSNKKKENEKRKVIKGYQSNSVYTTLIVP